jgi:hypothetical protein
MILERAVNRSGHGTHVAKNEFMQSLPITRWATISKALKLKIFAVSVVIELRF